MVNYSNGKIYKIEPLNGEEGDIYIGSTTKEYLSQRLDAHRSGFKQFITGKRKHSTTSFKLFEKYGIENCFIVLLELVDAKSKDELHSREAQYIKTLQCINKLIPLRTTKEWYEDNREHIKEYNKEYKESNKEKIQEYNESNKEKIKEYRVIYYETNKDIIKDKIKDWRENNKEKIKERKKLYYKSNRDEFLKVQKEYREANIDKVKEIQKKYHEANKDRINEKKRELRKQKKILLKELN